LETSPKHCTSSSSSSSSSSSLPCPPHGHCGKKKRYSIFLTILFLIICISAVSVLFLVKKPLVVIASAQQVVDYEADMAITYPSTGSADESTLTTVVITSTLIPQATSTTPAPVATLSLKPVASSPPQPIITQQAPAQRQTSSPPQPIITQQAPAQRQTSSPPQPKAPAERQISSEVVAGPPTDTWVTPYQIGNGYTAGNWPNPGGCTGTTQLLQQAFPSSNPIQWTGEQKDQAIRWIASQFDYMVMASAQAPSTCFQMVTLGASNGRSVRALVLDYSAVHTGSNIGDVSQGVIDALGGVPSSGHIDLSSVSWGERIPFSTPPFGLP
jgi:hypothetical protein